MEFLQTWQQKQWGDSVQHEKISAKDLDVIGKFSLLVEVSNSFNDSIYFP